MSHSSCPSSPFFFNDPATTEIYTLSLHDALPIFDALRDDPEHGLRTAIDLLMIATSSPLQWQKASPTAEDRKSTRLNSSHSSISYAVFCLKKKKREEISVHDFCASVTRGASTVTI